MDELKSKIGYSFKNAKLLKAALTHSSFANESRASNASSNERLEFLGDSVLGMIVAHHLYLTYPDLPEGKMTRMRAELVCETSLVRVAAQLELGNHIILGKGEEQSGGRQRTSILADAVEAIIAALYLDGGMEAATRFVHKFILSGLFDLDSAPCSDYKTMLQELVQQKSGQLLRYVLLEESGPDHLKVFKTEVRLNEGAVGEGTGRTKKEAEQAAARHALGEMLK